MGKIAIITGITGQDGSYLAEFLLKKNYIVHGIKRKSSSFNTSRIDEIFNNPKYNNRFFLHYGDLTDTNSINLVIKKIVPDEIYNLAAQSHVGISFQMPEYTTNVNALGTLRILDSIKYLGFEKKTKFYQASTSELYGQIQEKKQSENTKFYPKSPYASSKLFSYWITKNYRESYNIFASNGILFNHESPRRGETFVTRKITIGLSRIINGLDKCLYLGNLYALRDWGHAKDYVEAQWLMLQQKKPDDFVISTGKNYSVKQFINMCAKYLGIKLKWSGKGINTKAHDQNGKCIIACSKKYYRPTEVDVLLGNSSKAKRILKWKPKISFQSLVKEMIDYDYNNLKKNYSAKKR